MLKAAVIVTWVWGLLSFFVAPESTVSTLGRWVFCILVVVHAIECAVFLPKMRAAGGSLGGHVWNTFVFGVLHVRELEPEAS